MHEDLLGYLLGALEPEEMQRISQWLKNNPEGQAELAKIEQSLRPLEDSFEAIEAPSEDLLQRTLAGIPDGPPPALENTSEGAPPVTLSDVELIGEAGGSGSRWSMIDSIGGLLSVATLLALLLPTIAAGRGEARKVACQDQLRELGSTLIQYVFRDDQGRLPQVAESGPEAFSGMYAIRLAEMGLLPESDPRWCPSAEMPDLTQQRLSTRPSDPPQQLIEMNALPNSEALHSLPVNELKQVQRYAGGHYAYNLGVIDEQGYSSPRYEGRASFAVMADAPIGQMTRPGDLSSFEFSHGGEGINVLYEDGAVRFIRASALHSIPDHPFFNHRGVSEAGINIDDASLSPSWRGPFKLSVQR